MRDDYMLSCAIVDDEPTARYGLRSYVNRYPHLRCVGEFQSAMLFGDYLRYNKSPDIVFMDIQMPGITGLDFIASHTVDSAVIIVTAYEQYALRGYELNVCDYMLKPVSYARFQQAVEKASQYIDYRKGVAWEDCIYVRADRMLHRLPLKDIVYIEALENYVTITTLSERITTRCTLKDLLSQLPEKDFMRVHKSYAVNLRHISSISSTGIYMKGIPRDIPLSRSFRDPLFSALKEK